MFLPFPRLVCFPSVSEQRFHSFWVIFGLIKGRGKGGRKNPTNRPAWERRGKGRRGRRQRLSAAAPGTAGPGPGRGSGRAAPFSPSVPPRAPPALPRGLGMSSEGRAPSSPSAARVPSEAGDPLQRGDLRANLIN